MSLFCLCKDRSKTLKHVMQTIQICKETEKGQSEINLFQNLYYKICKYAFNKTFSFSIACFHKMFSIIKFQ